MTISPSGLGVSLSGALRRADTNACAINASAMRMGARLAAAEGSGHGRGRSWRVMRSGVEGQKETRQILAKTFPSAAGAVPGQGRAHRSSAMFQHSRQAQRPAGSGNGGADDGDGDGDGEKLDIGVYGNGGRMYDRRWEMRHEGTSGAVRGPTVASERKEASPGAQKQGASYRLRRPTTSSPHPPTSTMRFIFPSLAAFVAFVAAQADPSINTPAAVVQCQPAQISFTATKTPVFISIIPGGQPSAAPLADLGQQSASPFTWRANIPSGTSITFQIRDSTGAVAYSAPVTIQDSSDSSCLGQSGSASGGASTTPAGSSAPATSSVVATTVPPSSSVEASTSSVVVSVSSVAPTATQPATTSRAVTSASSSRVASATSASASASASPNAARSNAQVGFAGLLGLAAAVVMA